MFSIFRRKKDILVDEIKIPLFEFYKKVDWFFIKDYFKGYSNLDGIIVNQNDLENVENLSNTELLNFIGEIINSIDPDIFRRKIAKVHNEDNVISIELPIKSSFQLGIYYMYIVVNFKREITSEIQEEVASKIFRPFVNCGGKAIVVFISMGRGVDKIYNEVKKFSDYIKWTVEGITYETFVKLLKYNNLI